MRDVELIIKIPEEEYRWIMKSDKTTFADVASKECMLHAIKNGTPLHKVKAEIDQKQYDFMSDGDYNEGVRFGLMLAYQIIDKHKEEGSEVQEEL